MKHLQLPENHAIISKDIVICYPVHTDVPTRSYSWEMCCVNSNLMSGIYDVHSLNDNIIVNSVLRNPRLSDIVWFFVSVQTALAFFNFWLQHIFQEYVEVQQNWCGNIWVNTLYFVTLLLQMTINSVNEHNAGHMLIYTDSTRFHWYDFGSEREPIKMHNHCLLHSF